MNQNQFITNPALQTQQIPNQKIEAPLNPGTAAPMNQYQMSYMPNQPVNQLPNFGLPQQPISIPNTMNYPTYPTHNLNQPQFQNQPPVMNSMVEMQRPVENVPEAQLISFD